MTDVHPTGTCFDDSLDLLAELAKGKDLDVLYLVHAICENPINGEPYAHAWVEDEELNLALFNGIINGVTMTLATSIAEYHDHLRVIEMTRYNYMEALAQNLESGHYGPWIERYLKLCRNYKENKHARSDRSSDRHQGAGPRGATDMGAG